MGAHIYIYIYIYIYICNARCKHMCIHIWKANTWVTCWTTQVLLRGRSSAGRARGRLRQPPRWGEKSCRDTHYRMAPSSAGHHQHAGSKIKQILRTHPTTRTTTHANNNNNRTEQNRTDKRSDWAALDLKTPPSSRSRECSAYAEDPLPWSISKAESGKDSGALEQMPQRR